MDTPFLFLAGIGLCYALLILAAFRHNRQKSKAVPLNSKIMDINFSLEEGYTIIGVMDMKKTMSFYIGNETRDEKSYE